MVLSELIGLNCPDQPHLGPHSPTLPRSLVSAPPQAAAPFLSCACGQLCFWTVFWFPWVCLRPDYSCLVNTGLLMGSAAVHPAQLAQFRPPGTVPS